jgi:hypothetical protein
VLYISEKRARSNIFTYYSFTDKVIFMLYSMYYVMKPFYFWDSGLPQIADIIMLLLMVMLLIKKKFRLYFNVETKALLQTGLFFVIYVLFINLVWMWILGTSAGFAISSLFYIYNFIIVLCAISLYCDYKSKIIEITYKAVLISVLLQILIYFVEGGFTGSRMTGGFNNPNQFGYYSLLIVSFLMFINRRLKIPTRWLLLGVTSSIILAIASLSKAAIFSIFGLICLLLFSQSQNKGYKIKVILIIAFTVCASTYLYNYTSLIKENKMFQSLQMRIQNTGLSNDDNIEGRGYLRIINYPQYWILGSGEGKSHSRFNDNLGEFHSTLGNIQVSYGIIGFILFLRFMYLALKNDSYRNIDIVFMLMVYGFTHNGIRNSFFWILLALISVNLKKPESDYNSSNLYYGRIKI